MLDVQEFTISQAHEGFLSRNFTCHDLVSAFLERIGRLDKKDHESGPKINSTMALSSTALTEASELDTYFQSSGGKFKGPLHGIPVLVKDQADTKGLVTTYGSEACKSNIPSEDAFIITKLKNAGAVILGKTTMSEWASTWFSASSSTDWVSTQNPYKSGYDVGGSSSGSAAAVAANFCILAVAEDTGGSIRCPASFTNTVGIRPTVGLVSRHGFCPLIKTQDTPGPIARTVEDCAKMLDILVGFDPADEFTSIAWQNQQTLLKSSNIDTPQSYASNLDPKAITKARLGVVRELFGPSTDPASRLVNKVINNCLSTLSANGTTLIDITIPDLKHYLTYTPTYTLRSRADINSFLSTKPHLPSDISQIVPHPHPRPFLDLTSTIAHGPSDPTSDPTYVSRLLTRDAFQRLLVSIMAQNDLDALTFPSIQIPAPRHIDAENGRFPTCWDFPVNTLLASQGRLPAINVPAGFCEAAEADANAEEQIWHGLPVGLELVSWEYRERELFDLARGVEVLVGARKRPVLD
ncbi:putative amidase family [Phaeomoniella chlamydospora]|uniref:Putative amidase family n=1 Tax=Phaeomoniella chlamydospora TaxID=158046 RepID=A0A0G2E0J6_PHACM|nr:putative amidase family [Phaeomoniella chlamydospora]